jgi:hypothetical protein
MSQSALFQGGQKMSVGVKKKFRCGGKIWCYLRICLEVELGALHCLVTVFSPSFSSHLPMDGARVLVLKKLGWVLQSENSLEGA